MKPMTKVRFKSRLFAGWVVATLVVFGAVSVFANQEFRYDFSTVPNG